MISHNDIVAMIQDMDMPWAYHHFAEGESPEAPFLVFLYPASDNFSADGRVYVKFNELNIELYTKKKDPEAELQVEDVLDDNGLFYQKSETFIESENLYEVIYEMRLV